MRHCGAQGHGNASKIQSLNAIFRPEVRRERLERVPIRSHRCHSVMAGLEPAISRRTVLDQMAGSSPAMT
jgi:hypothetical protein